MVAFQCTSPPRSLAVSEQDLPTAMANSVVPYYQQHLKFDSFIGQSGIPIVFSTYVLPDEKGALVLIGGRTEYMRKYAELVYDLRDLGYSVYLMDHRGQGLSGRMLPDSHKGHVDSFADYVADFKTFITKVVKPETHRQTFVIAHSMGAAIVTRFLQQNSVSFDGVVFSAPMFEINTGFLPESFALFVVRLLSTLGFADAYSPGSKDFTTQKPFFNNDLTHSQSRYSFNNEYVAQNPGLALGAPTNGWVREALQVTRDILTDSKKLHTPILLLLAGQDKVVLAGRQAQFCRAATQCQQVVFPDALHEILMERDGTRDQAINRIRRFLSGEQSGKN